MKKILLFVAFVALSFTASAQFSGGVNIGIPTGNASNVSSFAFGVDLNYMLSSEEDFSYGLAAGYQNFSGKNGAGSVSFLPIAASGRFGLSDSFSAGADVGYAIGMSPSGNDGGFYYRPMVVYSLSDTMDLNASYSGVSVTGGTWSSFGVGIMFDF